MAHTVDLLFVLTLFAVFAISALLVLLLGIKVYHGTTADMNTNYTTRTALTYVTEKVRQNDTSGCISVSRESCGDVLRLRTAYNNTAYITYIYEFNGSLCELFTKEEQDFDPASGSELMEISDFTARTDAEGLLYISVTGTDSVSADTWISYRSRI